MTTYWFPAYGHPDGTARDRPWFRVEGDSGYRASGHPDGRSEQPCFHLTHGRVSPILSLPGPTDAEISFFVMGSFVYPAGSAGAPWFRVQPVGTPRVGDATRGRQEPAVPNPALGTKRDPANEGTEPKPSCPRSQAGVAKGATMHATMAKHGGSGSSRHHLPFERTYLDVNPPVDGCPACRSTSICWVPGSEGQMNYLCEACGRCWTRTSNGTVRVSPVTCPGCAHRGNCFGNLRSEIAAFTWRPA